MFHLMHRCACIPCQLMVHAWKQAEEISDDDEQFGYLTLTPSEQKILNQLASGQSNKEIANSLHLAEPTIKNTLSIMFRKLHVQDRTQAAILAWKLGLVTRVTLESQ